MTVSVVRDTFFRGDYELCLALCDAFQSRDAKDAVEIALLRARCLIPLGRSEHAIEVLRALRLADDQHDEYLTGRALLSAAYINLGQHDRGLEMARETYEKLDGAHPTVSAEVTANLGMAHFWKGEYARAERILESVPEDADIVYAQVLLYRGYIAWASNDYAGSVDKFRNALRMLDTCKHCDRFVEARCIFGLTYLCGELPRLDLWPEVAERIRRFDWTVSGVATWRYWTAVEASFIAELLGDMDGSTKWARLAEDIAPDDSARIAAWCRLAARFGRYGETAAHGYFVDKARDTYEAMPADARRGNEQRSLPLAIADETVYGPQPMAAAPLLTYYAEAIIPSMRGHAQERVLEASHAMILGHFEERRGNRARAEEAYLRSFERFGSLGFLRRAAIVPTVSWF